MLHAHLCDNCGRACRWERGQSKGPCVNYLCAVGVNDFYSLAGVKRDSDSVASGDDGFCRHLAFRKRDKTVGDRRIEFESKCESTSLMR